MSHTGRESQAAVPVAGTSRRGTARLIGLGVSALLLVALYRSVDVHAVVRVFQQASVGWLIVSLGMVVPITLLRAARFQLVAPSDAVDGYGGALRLTLVASAFNTFLPSKSGDLIKSFFIARTGNAKPGEAIAVVAYERLTDLVGLLTWCLVAWAVDASVQGVLPRRLWLMFALLLLGCVTVSLSTRGARGVARLITGALPQGRLTRIRGLADGWPELHERLGTRRATVVAGALLLWLVQLCQIWMFALAVRAPLPFTQAAGLGGVALLVGQLPFTFGGIGARDVALVLLLAGLVPPETAAAMGILTASRGLLPPLAALPMLRPHVAALVEAGRGLKRS